MLGLHDRRPRLLSSLFFPLPLRSPRLAAAAYPASIDVVVSQVTAVGLNWLLVLRARDAVSTSHGRFQIQGSPKEETSRFLRMERRGCRGGR